MELRETVVVVSVESENCPNHVHKVEHACQIRGIERDQLGNRVLANGISNVIEENICINNNLQQKNGYPSKRGINK